MKPETTEKLLNLKNSILVYDLETCASYPDGTKINLGTDFENYVRYAKAKWFGCYSYKYGEYIYDEIKGNEAKIKSLIAEHNLLVGFNNEEFDTPILYNNELISGNRYYKQVDCLPILGSSVFQRHDGLPFKNRGALMGYKFKKNSLKDMAETMKLDTQKGDIDYNIFFQDTYTEQERADILKYLKADVEITKQMFDKLWDYWYPFTQFLSEKNILNLSWIKSSIASLRYKGDCFTLGVEETYADRGSTVKEKMGGNVIAPKYQESRNIVLLDYASLYPWIRNMFGIDREIVGMTEEQYQLYLAGYGDTETPIDTRKIFHKNEMFECKGYYDISEQSPIAIKSVKNLTMRGKLKVDDPENPMIYTIKIYENAGYGALRSPIFEQIHTPNAGWDICWVGQQMQSYIDKRMTDFGYETIAGDTDSVFVMALEGVRTDKEYIKECLATIIGEIQKYVPFPNESFIIDIDDFIEYIMWPFSLEPIEGPDGKNLKNEKGRLIKELRGKKKNYLYLTKDKLKIKGLPIKKDNATAVGQKLLKEKLKPMILDQRTAKFDKKIINQMLEDELSAPDGLTLLAVEWRCKPFASYKKESQIQAQISAGYFGGQAGVISLIKNKKFGNAGKTSKYCTAQEFLDNKLELEDLDLTKIKNELAPFNKGETNDK